MTNQILERFLEADLDPCASTSVELRRPEPAREPAAWRRGPRHRRRVAVVLAFVVVVSVVGSVLLSAENEELASPPGIGALMTASANAAETGSANGIEYTRSVVTSSGLVASERPFTTYSPTAVETWIRPDGSGRLRIVDLPDEWPGPRDRRRAAELDLAGSGVKASQRVDLDAELGAPFIELKLLQEGLPLTSELPSDPDELKLSLQAEYTDDPSIERDRRIFQLASQVVLLPTASPELRAASFEVMAGLDSAVIETGVKDPRGRPATAASVTDKSGLTSTLYFDPTSSQALAEIETTEEPSEFIDSRLIGSAVVEKVEQVDSLTDR